MADKKPPTIVRSETFTVKSSTKNEYGALIVTDTAGQHRKVSEKREHLFPVFQAGAEVKVGYGTYMQKDYIAIAEQTGKHVDVPQTNKPMTQNGITGQTIGMTCKELGDMLRAKMLTPVFGPSVADRLVSWYQKQIMTNTSVQGDLPIFYAGEGPTARNQPAESKDTTSKPSLPPSPKPTSNATAYTAKTVLDGINKLVDESVWTTEQAKARVIALGGKGNGRWTMIQSLTPENLGKLHQAVLEAKAEVHADAEKHTEAGPNSDEGK